MNAIKRTRGCLGATALCALLAACSAAQVQTGLDTVVGGLPVLEAAAARYAALPPCGAGASRLCSRADVVAELDRIDRRVRSLLDQARSNPALVQTLAAEVEALRSLVSKI